MSTRKRSSFWTVMLALLLSAGCLGNGLADENEHFFRQPMNERREAITKYPLARQVDLYLLAMLTKHPPDLGLADAVASNGPSIVPFLTRRLAKEESDLAKMQLIDVFERMQSLGTYSVATDTTTMRLLEQHASAMKDPQWKGMASDLLDKIKAAKTR